MYLQRREQIRSELLEHPLRATVRNIERSTAKATAALAPCDLEVPWRRELRTRH